jgi:UDP-N-acetylenolpyruvoylglucosamine reductase
VVSPTDFADAGRRATSLARRTSFRIGGTPEFLFEPATEAEAGAVIAACRRAGVPLRVLGGGCNLLVADGRLEGAVLATSGIRFERVLADRVEVGAGCSFPSLVARSAELRVPALSGCPGIPGTVGGVVAMNAGGRFGCVGDAVIEVRGFDAAGVAFARRVEPGDLGYRRSIFSSGLFEGGVVTSAAFRRDPALDVDAARRLFAEASAWKRATQPLSAASAGCVFKNPPTVPPKSASAGALIDGAGLKGERAGRALVSPLHANFIVNEGGASFSDVLALIDRVRARVAEKDGVALDLEVKVWR